MLRRPLPSHERTIQCPISPRQTAPRRPLTVFIAAIRAPEPEVRTLSQMAELACLSPYHFCRVFRRAAGIPPAAIFGALRLERAKRLLLDTDLSVTEICYALGYTSLGAFTTRFSHHVGVSPGRFRRLPELTVDTLERLERPGASPRLWPNATPAISRPRPRLFRYGRSDLCRSLSGGHGPWPTTGRYRPRAARSIFAAVASPGSVPLARHQPATTR